MLSKSKYCPLCSFNPSYNVMKKVPVTAGSNHVGSIWSLWNIPRWSLFPFRLRSCFRAQNGVEDIIEFLFLTFWKWLKLEFSEKAIIRSTLSWTWSLKPWNIWYIRLMTSYSERDFVCFNGLVIFSVPTIRFTSFSVSI